MGGGGGGVGGGVGGGGDGGGGGRWDLDWLHDTLTPPTHLPLTAT